MCTIMTITRAMYTRDYLMQLWDDSINNPHGFALILVNEDGAQTVLRTMNFNQVITALEEPDWERMFLHCRWATQGGHSLQNTHGWEVDGVFYMHNGCLFNKRANGLPVDSMLIGEWIREGGDDYALEMLMNEGFANVFLINNEGGYYAVQRSRHGSLFTDGEGNYSTNEVGVINIEVPEYTVNWFRLVEPSNQKQEVS